MRFSIKRMIACVALAVIISATLFGCGVPLSPDITPHLVPVTEPHVVAADGFDPFDMPDAAAATYRERVEIMYTAVVYDGKRPVFSDPADPVKSVYDAAHNVLAGYIHDEWQDSEINTVHVIHDWLIAAVDYDFALYDAYRAGNTDLSDDPSFHIDGVFTDGTAVCDGLARAFNFLCAMEGIASMRVTGTFASSPHAWNKVFIGGEWFNVDVTADAAHYSVGSDSYKQLAHGYFLLSDDTIKSFAPNGHDFIAPDPELAAVADHDFCADGTVDIGGKSFSRTVRDMSELNAVFAAVKSQNGKIGKIELKLDFAGKSHVNGADMYFDEIAAAYDKIGNSSFEISKDVKPYFRYPNGVYLFLIYK